MATQVSASALPRLSKCAASITFHGLSKGQESNYAADRGTAKHMRAMGAPLDSIDQRFRKDCASIDPSVFPPTADHEVALAYDVCSEEARLIGYDIGREYGEVGHWEIVGSIDFLVVGNERVQVIDIKTGSYPVSEHTAQLKFAALAAAHLHERDQAIATIATMDQDNDVHFSSVTYNERDLNNIAIELRTLMFRVRAEESQDHEHTDDCFTPGDHCKFCPGRDVCPGRAERASEMIEAPDLVLGSLGQAIAKDPARAWRSYKLATELLNDIKTAFEKHIDEHGPIEYEPGLVVRRKDEVREYVRADVALELLEQSFGRGAAIAAREPKTSKARIKRVLSDLDQGGKYESFIEALRGAGGISERVSRPIREAKA